MIRLLISVSTDFVSYEAFSSLLTQLIAKWQYDNVTPLSLVRLVCDSRDYGRDMMIKFGLENKVKTTIYPYEWRKYLLNYVTETGDCSLVVFKRKDSTDVSGIIKSCKREDIPVVTFTI